MERVLLVIVITSLCVSLSVFCCWKLYKELTDNKIETQKIYSYIFNSFFELGWGGAALTFVIISIAGIFQTLKMLK